MLHEKPARYGPLGGDVDGMNMAWKKEKRRRKHLTQSSSSDAPAATAQGHQAPISSDELFGPGKAAKDHQGSISDMAIIQAQNHVLLSREEVTQELFGPKVSLTMEDQASYARILLPNIRPPIDNETPSMSFVDHLKVHVRHGRYRVAYYQLPDSTEPEYPDADGYREHYHTYEMDAVYVKYYGEISKKIKWIEEYLHLDARSAEWRDMETRAWRQALRIATQLPHMTVRLAAFAYHEYIHVLRDDASLKDLDLVYFEIWRLVVKDNRDYKEAVKEVLAMDKFHMHKRTMEAELMGAPVFVTMRQRIYNIIKEGHIVANTEDNKARDMFQKGVARLKTKNMVNYAKKKMEIAEVLNLHKRIEVPG